MKVIDKSRKKMQVEGMDTKVRMRVVVYVEGGV